MPLWLEPREGSNRYAVTKQIGRCDTSYGFYEIYDSNDFGKILTLDGSVYLTEYDEKIYHELLCHPGCQCTMEMERTLVFGGGFGGSARELLKYPHTGHIDLVEIDDRFIDFCQKKINTKVFDDTRLNVFLEKGDEFISKSRNKYDLIIIDTPIFNKYHIKLDDYDFIKNCADSLNPHGVFITRIESPFHPDAVKFIPSSIYKLKKRFQNVYMYWGPIPSAPFFSKGFAFCSDYAHPEFIHREFRPVPDQLRYYSKKLHLGLFKLPQFIDDFIDVSLME